MFSIASTNTVPNAILTARLWDVGERRATDIKSVHSNPEMKADSGKKTRNPSRPMISEATRYAHGANQMPADTVVERRPVMVTNLTTAGHLQR